MAGNTHWSESEVQKLKENYSETRTPKLAEEFEGRTPKALERKAQRLNLKKNENEIIKNKAQNLEEPDYEKEYSNFITGLIAGEGSFTKKRENTYTFKIGMASREKEMLKDIKNYLGIGKIYEYSQKEGWENIVQYQVQSRAEILGVLIPFLEQTGLKNSYKNKQYQEWKKEFIKSHGYQNLV